MAVHGAPRGKQQRFKPSSHRAVSQHSASETHDALGAGSRQQLVPAVVARQSSAAAQHSSAFAHESPTIVQTSPVLVASVVAPPVADAVSSPVVEAPVDPFVVLSVVEASVDPVPGSSVVEDTAVVDDPSEALLAEPSSEVAPEFEPPLLPSVVVSVAPDVPPDAPVPLSSGPDDASSSVPPTVRHAASGGSSAHPSLAATHTLQYMLSGQLAFPMRLPQWSGLTIVHAVADQAPTRRLRTWAGVTRCRIALGTRARRVPR
jgi:hypothetical protein